MRIEHDGAVIHATAHQKTLTYQIVSPNLNMFTDRGPIDLVLDELRAEYDRRAALPRGTWLTNLRRADVEGIIARFTPRPCGVIGIGDPKATPECSVESLVAQDVVGIYAIPQI